MTLIGLKPGTVTPIALHHDVGQKVEVVLDRKVDQSDTIGIHPSVNTTTLVISLSRFYTFAHIGEASSYLYKYVGIFCNFIKCPLFFICK